MNSCRAAVNAYSLKRYYKTPEHCFTRFLTEIRFCLSRSHCLRNTICRFISLRAWYTQLFLYTRQQPNWFGLLNSFVKKVTSSYTKGLALGFAVKFKWSTLLMDQNIIVCRFSSYHPQRDRADLRVYVVPANWYQRFACRIIHLHSSLMWLVLEIIKSC